MDPQPLHPSAPQTDAGPQSRPGATSDTGADLQAQKLEAAARLNREIVHDLNNVLQTIKSAMDLLRCREPNLDSRSAGLIDTVKRSVDAGTGMTQRLLAFWHNPLDVDPYDVAAKATDAPIGPQPPAADAATPAVGDPARAPGTDRTSAPKRLAGLRVLVIEDESLVAMLVEDMLDQLGCAVVASVSDAQQALDSAARSEVDFALLDVNLRGRPSYAVAEALAARAVPFMFMSGYGAVEERWRNRPVIQKPFELDRLRREMERALRAE